MRRGATAASAGLLAVLAAWLPTPDGAARLDRVGFLVAGALVGFGLARLPAGRRPLLAAPPPTRPEPAAVAADGAVTPAPSTTPAPLGTAAMLAPAEAAPDAAAQPPDAPDIDPVVPADPVVVVADPVVELFAGVKRSSIGSPAPEPVGRSAPAAPGGRRREAPDGAPATGSTADAAVVSTPDAAETVAPPEGGAPAVGTRPKATGPTSARSKAPGSAKAAGSRAKTAGSKTSASRPAAAKASGAKAHESAKAGASGAKTAGSRAKTAGSAKAAGSAAATRPVAHDARTGDGVPTAGEGVEVTSDPARMPSPTADAMDGPPDAAAPVEALDVPSSMAVDQLVAAKLASRGPSLDHLVSLATGDTARPRRAATTGTGTSEADRASGPLAERSRPGDRAPFGAPARPGGPSAASATNPASPSGPGGAPARRSETIDDGAPAASIVERLARRAVSGSGVQWSMAQGAAPGASAWALPVSPDEARRATEDVVRASLGRGAAAAADDDPAGPPTPVGTRPTVGRVPPRGAV